ncbi:MAG: ATP-binding protein [Candidatus Cloacimonetes bacterium]|jgi:signal transduction histidine kinase/serine/threonine protein kinase|nr:protein kinase [Candidatus Cloacimonadota bacterium]MCK9184829.1 ATP-binding protein [Candidatus Cloacimonadota bacterium]MCK9584089.1 ATP-binding protein [Candidatus Cloacimonadota bacterium]
MYIDHRYEVLESLGSGSWANMFKVRDIRTDRSYTLKLFQYLSSEELYRYFSAEDMHHITKIEHPNLSHVVDFGHVGDHIYFISEYFEGKTLAHFRFSKSKVNLIYDIVVQICYALHALHRQNILHKDLKLENVLYHLEKSQITVKLIDYGFSKIDPGHDTQHVSGSLPYLAPELYLGAPPSESSDFYALGVMLYRLCTGSFPFSIDQINALITGGHQYFIPNFPSELNKNIPPELEKFILRLLERNPQNRFASGEEIIGYINRIHHDEYPFSVSWSVVNTMRFNSYIVREKYAHQILDFVPAVTNSNGKIISVIGGDGLGKDSILSLFRYHLLGGEFFLFDYACTRTDHEAFFALIKEYLQSLNKEETAEYRSLQQISSKFKRYLFASEQEARTLTQSADDLKSDFESVKSLLAQLVQNKPVIFVIRNFQYVSRHTLDFINYISPFLVQSRMMIVLSCNDFNKVSQIEHTVLINIPFLSKSESKPYINRLLPIQAPAKFIDELHQRSAGNPHFIREILIDLVQKKSIALEHEIKFPEDLQDYQLPSRLMHSIYSRMSHLTTLSYAHLQKLSIVQTPLSRELMIYILKLKDIELYNLLNDANYNEILNKEGKDYSFTFREAKNRMFEESDEKVHVLVSKRLLKYFSNKKVNDRQTCLGLIDNAMMAKDLQAARHYYLVLTDMFSEDYEQAQAYEAMLNVLKLDFDPQTNVSIKDIIQDLRIFQEKTELTGFFQRAGFLLENSALIPELFEKYYAIGTIHSLREDHKKAMESFKKAELLRITGRQQLQIWLCFIRFYLQSDLAKAKYFIDKALAAELPLDLRIAYVDRLAVYHNIKGDTDKAIKLLEDFLEEIPPEHDYNVLIRLAAMHNDLGVFYSDQKHIEEAGEHLNQALSIWKRYNIRRYWGLIYNNLSDIYLKQGITVEASKYSHLAYKYSTELNLTSMKALALLNQGEAKIKMGEFHEAERLLLSCKSVMESINSEIYMDSVKRNLALAKSKIKGFGHYYGYIMEQKPELTKGKLTTINPLVKTYFYYLHEMKSPKKLRKLLSSNVQIDFKHLHEEEFHHNVLSLIAMAEDDFEKALSELKLALRHAGEINNNYAITVFYILEATCHYGLGDFAKTQELIDKARVIAENNSYRYWLCNLDILQLKLGMLSTSMPLRDVLRRVNRALADWHDYEYYQLNVELLQIRIQVLVELKQEHMAAEAFLEYQKYLINITKDIPEVDKANYLSVNLYSIKDLRKFNLVALKSRSKDLRRKWTELLFNITNVYNVDRIRFLMEKGINEVLAPWQFRLMEFSDRIQNYTAFISHNCDKDSLIDPFLNKEVERALKLDNMLQIVHNERHVAIIPLLTGSKRVGYLLLSDDGELPFTKQEISIMRNIKQHLSALIVRVQDYSEITIRIQKMNQLMQISHELMSIVDIADLEHEIVSNAIDFTNSSRGFLIKRDSDGNNIYKVQINNEKQILTNVAGVSKTALSLSQNSLEMVSTFNALEDNRFKSAISVQDYQLHTIFCTPISVDGNIFGFLYLDNMNDNTRAMYLKEEIIALFIKQLSIAIKNAMLYQNVLQKSSELNAFEMLKDEFMAIVSHELNTPLTTLQSYVSRLKRNLYADEDERTEIIGKIESSVKKLIITTGDITTMNNYNLKKSLNMAPVLLEEILELVQQEVDILSRKRKMFIRSDIEKGLPEISANWEALHLMIYNLVLNAIRFTNDFGTIVIGARKAAFQQEKIEGKDSVVIYVQDNGIGIPEYQLKNVFRKFYELNEIYAHKSGTIEYRSSGLGLGLATSRRIAELHHGKIWIKSKENEGTTVFVSLPLKK